MRLGIDFGTTRTVVAAVDRGNYPVLRFEAPDGTEYDWFPSVVAVTDKERVYGWEAWAKQQELGWSVFRSVKRVLENAGTDTRVDLEQQQVPLLTLLSEMAAAVRAALPESETYETMLGVPANANTNQRFLTAEAFRSGGFDVVGLLNEPSAASIEYAHKNKLRGSVLVYDLGGGTFDASLVELGERDHRVIASEGIHTLGGDDFDHLLAELAVPPSDWSMLSQTELFRLHEECRVKKEALNPNSRKLMLELDNVREGWGTVAIPVSDYYEFCRPLVDETVRLVEDVVGAHAEANLDVLYVTGGGSELPLVSRVLRESFGRRVKRSAYTRSATAIGLAIQADSQAGYVLRDKFTRYFGVWRESDAGRNIIFDPLFEKGTPLPTAGDEPLEIRRSYFPVHNVGVFRYLECSQVDEAGRPAGDITVWDEARFPFDGSREDESNERVHYSDTAADQQIEEHYVCDSGGTVKVTISNLTAKYSREYKLGRWAAKETVAPAKSRKRTQRARSAQ